MSDWHASEKPTYIQIHIREYAQIPYHPQRNDDDDHTPTFGHSLMRENINFVAAAMANLMNRKYTKHTKHSLPELASERLEKPSFSTGRFNILLMRFCLVERSAAAHRAVWDCNFECQFSPNTNMYYIVDVESIIVAGDVRIVLNFMCLLVIWCLGVVWIVI